jgi:hypothetical protein
MRLLSLCLLAIVLGCAAEDAGPSPITAAERDAIKQYLAPLKARITSDLSDGLYLSLRNTHVQILQFGGSIESTPRARSDVQDFTSVSQAVAKSFLDAGELETFKRQLQSTLSGRGSSSQRSEYKRVTVSLTRTPLRLVLSAARAAPTTQ